jgi:hypothetical protein
MVNRNFINDASISTLARSYNILDYFQNLKTVVSHTYTGTNLEQFSKFDLHWLINELLLEHYCGECTLKAKLVDLFIQTNATAAFEIKVNNSRVDFLTINGKSRSFEIKSELDNLYKLSKQINDYEKVFDENYIAIDEKHYSKAIRLIPDQYGIMVLHGSKLTMDREPLANKKLEPEMQLNLFSKKELSQIFKLPGITKEEIFINFEPEEINNFFKDMLKRRYSKRWQFLVDNQKNICSIDYQFFFQHNILPEIIYY